MRWDVGSEGNNASPLTVARVVVLAMLVFVAQLGAAYDGTPRTYQTAEFMMSDAVLPPASSASWRPVELPDDWNRTRPNAAGIGWYRFGLTPPVAGSRPLAVLLPYLSMGASVYVNDHYIGDTGRPYGRGTSATYRPWMFTVSRGEFDAIDNYLYVRLVGYPNMHSGLGVIELGDRHRLQREYDRLYFLKVQSTGICAVFIGSLGWLSLSVWWLRRSELHYLHFALAAGFFAASTAQYVARDEFFPLPYWGAFIIGSVIASASFCVLFSIRFVGLASRRMEGFVLLYAVTSFAVLMSVGSSRLFLAGSILICILVLVLLGAATLIFMRWRNAGGTEPLIIASTSAVLVPVAAHDLAVHAGFLPMDTLHWMTYGATLVSAAMGFILIRRYALAVFERDSLIATLERKVEERSEQLQAERGRQLVQAERESIMRRVHDGVATDLALALTHLEHPAPNHGEVTRLLRSALDEARFSLNALSEVVDDLPTLLATLRQRVEPTLAANGISLVWAVDDTPPLANTSPQHIVDIHMIVKEAFKNVISHAQASEIRVGTGIDPESHEVFVAISDNGRGIAAAAEGIGIRGMRARAADCGGRLEIERHGSGTVVRLFVPCAGGSNE